MMIHEIGTDFLKAGSMVLGHSWTWLLASYHTHIAV